MPSRDPRRADRPGPRYGESLSSVHAWGPALNPDFLRNMLLLIGIAIGVLLVITLLVFMGGSRNPKRYRPGRPFSFKPVWFLSAPEQQSRAGLSTPARAGTSKEIVAGSARPGRVARPAETGGASDRW
jgi:hypothetical protein